ncbi:MAG: PDZ domain-containing protein [Candidatus Omnitrophica bacterium]|nr:PDZ domain-containing protein [Candidatus Omnitrophota bacterium]
MNKISLTMILPAFLAFPVALSLSDTVVMKSNEKIKGVVLEQYNDRVLVSTADGETEIMKKDIGDIVYDREEQNFASMGDYYQEKRMYQKAYYSYEKALKINPDFKQARDGINYVSTYLQQEERMIKLDHIKNMKTMTYGKIKKDEGAYGTDQKEKDVKKDLGIVIKSGKELYVINEVVKGSPAYTAGIKKGDVLESLWGKSVKYMDISAVTSRLEDPGVMDIQVTVQRTYLFDVTRAKKSFGNRLGIKFGYSEMEGLKADDIRKGSLADSKGMIKGDKIVEIQNTSTTFMTMEQILALINTEGVKKVMVKIKREIVMWKSIKS